MNGTVRYMKWFFHLNEQSHSLQKTNKMAAMMQALAVMELTGSEGNMLVSITTRDRKWLKLKP